MPRFRIKTHGIASIIEFVDSGVSKYGAAPIVA